MTSDLRFDFWDILKAPRIALSGKNLLAQARPLAYGYLIYLALAYLALLAEGQPLDYSWRTHGLFPFLDLGLTHWYSYAIWLSGIATFLVFFDFGNLTVSKLAFEEIRGNYFFPRKEAAADARGNLMSVWVAGGLVLFLVAILALLQGILSLVSLIPGIGQILYAILYIVPFFLWSLFLVFLAFGLVTSILTLPAIVVAREKEAFGATFFIYNVIWTQPLRWLGMTSAGLILAKIGVWVIGYFFMRSLQLTNFLSTWFGGEKVQNVLLSAYSLLEPARPISDFLTTLCPGAAIRYDWLAYEGYSSASGLEFISALIIAIGLLGLLIVIISYGINIVTCSQLLAFIQVVYAEDKVKLTEDPSKRSPEPNEIIPDKPETDSATI